MRAFSGILAILVLWSGPVARLHAQASDSKLPALDPKTEQALLDAANQELKAFGGKEPVPGAVLGVWMPGKAPWRAAVGLADMATNQKMQLDDKFRVGSNTKTFVITVLLQLVDEGKLKLDDPLSKFDLGVKVPNAENITVRELSQMRSGLFEAYNVPALEKMDFTPQTKITPRELVELAVKQPPMFAPGTRYSYCNTNYLLLGLIIEAVTHRPIQDEIQSRLIAPLGLRSTTFPTTNPDMPTPYTHGYMLDDKGAWQDSTVVLPPMLTWSAGVMISDMADMRVWVKDYVTGRTNSAATQKERLACISTGEPGLAFGLGIGCSGGWFGYTGGIPGYNTGAYYLPEEDVTIIVLVNSQREKPKPGVASAIVHDFAAILTPKHVPF